MQATEAPVETASGRPEGAPPPRPPAPSRVPSIIVALVVAAIAGLSIWYLVRPQPLLVQGEVDATRLDIAARVDGRVGDDSRRARPERRRRRRAGADRQSRDARQARAGAGRQGRGRGAARQHQRRHAAGGHRGAQGRAGTGAGERWSWRKRPTTASASWPSTAMRRRRGSIRSTDTLHESRARRRPGQVGLRAGGQRLHARGTRDRGRERRQGGRRHQGRAIDHRSDGDLRAGRLAGLQAQRRARRIRCRRACRWSR